MWDFPEGIDHKIQEASCILCNTEYSKRDTAKVFYQREGGQENYSCGKCGRLVYTANVLHRVMKQSSPVSGISNIKNELIPYCLECDDIPNINGSDI